MAGGSSNDGARAAARSKGMTCASCAARIERKLNKLEGVEATVNFATEQATVRCEPAVAVERARRRGRVDRLRRRPTRGRITVRGGAEARAHHHDEPLKALRLRLAVAIVLTLPLALLAMVPALHFAGWEWVALALSTPVVF